MISADKIERGLAAWIDSEMLPMMVHGTTGRILAGAAGGILCKRIGNAVSAMQDSKAAKLMGLVDGQGSIDLEIMRDELGKQIPDSGMPIPIPMIGTITLYRKDINTLYDYIARG